MNIIDFLAIMPFYVTMILDQLHDMKIIGRAGTIVRLVRVVRIIRVFKLLRRFAGLQSLIHTLFEAYRELGLLALLFSLCLLTFSVLIYYAEREDSKPINKDGKIETVLKSSNEANWNFIDSVWWCIMTLTTVGNRNYPSTKLGQLFGGLCAVAAVFLLTLPIPIVVNSFAPRYKNQMYRNEFAHRKAETVQKAWRRSNK